MPKILNYLIFTITSIAIGFALIPKKATAQNSFNILRPSDVEYFDEELPKAPNVLFSGYMEFEYVNEKYSLFGNRKNSYGAINAYLDMETAIFAQTSFNLRLATQPGFSGSAEDAYHYYSRTERALDAQKQAENGVRVERAYLEYRHNPLAKLRFGRQPISIGDKEGIVYKGDNLSVSQSCAIGTWCYYVGAAYPGETNRQSALIFYHISYALFDDEVKVEDDWGNLNSKNRLNVEAYWINYNYDKAALARYGGTTRNPNYSASDDKKYSIYQAKRGNNYVFRDIRWVYWGFNVDWQIYPVRLQAKYVSLAGRSSYFEETSQQDFTLIQKNTQHTGQAFLLKLDWRINKYNRVKLAGFIASGADNTTAAHERKSDTNFYEINKGTFGDANIYFSESSTTGQRHSLSNLSFVNASYDFQFLFAALGKINYKLDLYGFFKTRPITAASGKKENNIGFEIDNELTVSPSTNLDIKLSYSLFIAGKAFAENDNTLAPDGSEKTSSQINFGASYSF